MACTRAGVLLLAALAACAPPPPATRSQGALQSGGLVTVTDVQGNISLYAPARGQEPSSFSLEAYGADASRGTVVRRVRNHIAVVTTKPGIDLLLRGPKGSVFNILAEHGNINVADFDGVVNAGTTQGDIKMLLPQYGTARTGSGNVSVIFAATAWPGMLNFTADKGDVEIYVNQHAAAHVQLYALDGTIFTDFPLKGTASGTSERIDGWINVPSSGRGPHVHGINVYVRSGSIRLLQLKPQM